VRCGEIAQLWFSRQRIFLNNHKNPWHESCIRFWFGVFSTIKGDPGCKILSGFWQ
jgi:hypothetical protein